MHTAYMGSGRSGGGVAAQPQSVIALAGDGAIAAAFGWCAVIVAFLMIAFVHLQTTQGTYEDHAQVAAPFAKFWTARGLTKWTIAAQAQRQASPRAMRAVNVMLAAGVALATAGLVLQFGAPAWLGAGLVALHPLATEAMATLSGRGELIATLGVVGACLCVTAGRGAWWAWLAALGCLSLGYLGKETAALGIALVPLTAAAHGQRRMGRVAVVGIVLIALGAWHLYAVGVTPETLTLSGWTWAVRQGAAAERLLTLAIIPWHQTVDFDIDALAWTWCLTACAILMGLTALSVYLWRVARVVGLGLAWMLIAILPRLIVRTPKSYLNEHQFYVALIGFALLMAGIYREGVR